MRFPSVDMSDPRSILAALVGTRVMLTLVGLVSLAVMPRAVPTFDLVPDTPWLSLWSRYDSQYYLEIARDGYSFSPGRYSNAAFFPLYSLLIKLGSFVVGRSDPHALTFLGFVISNVCLFVALLYLAALVTRDFGVGAARRAVVYTLVFPTTLFLSAVYAESLFLATAIASFYHARRGEWYRAGLAGGLAALTRPFGFLLILPIAIEMWRQRPGIRAFPALGLVPAGTATFLAYLWWRFNDPLLYVKANNVWGREFAWPWDTFLGFLREPLVVFGWTRSVFDLAFVVAMTVLAVVAWRRLPASYAAFLTVGLLFTLSTGVWISTPRHALALFPLTILLAVWGERRAFHWVWLVLSVTLALGFMARFASGHWTA
ncbi:MAG: hypothetical protein H0V04_05225 [Chloroflexi bacterium]|nr:hypothetical protein [Chloroflexota bacterium]HEV8054002.1 mannosyltransferase family protein [Candidatus Limnocylindrales bacterium]